MKCSLDVLAKSNSESPNIPTASTGELDKVVKPTVGCIEKTPLEL